jgi:two-component system response regulator YesN
MMLGKNKKLLLQYLIYPLSILIVPVLITVIWFSQVYIDAFTDNTIENYQSDLERMADYFDNTIQTLDNMTIQIMKNPEISIKKEFRQPSSNRKIISMIQLYTSLYPVLQELIISIESLDMVYINEGTINRDILFSNKFIPLQFNDELRSQNNFDNPLNREIRINLNINSTSVIPYYKPLFSSQKNSYILFLLSKDVIEKHLFGKSSNISDSVFSVISYGEEVIRIGQLNEDVEYITLNAGTPEIREYLLDLPINHLKAHFQSIKVFFITSILAIFILDIMLSILFLRKNYIPINQLITLAATKSELHEEKDPLIYLNSAFNQLIIENKTMDEDQKSHIPAIKSSISLRLLTGSIPDKQELEEELGKIDISLSGESFFVFIIYYSRNCVERIKEYFDYVSEKDNPGVTTLHRLSYTDCSSIHIINTLDRVISGPREIAGSYMSYINDAYDLHVTIGVGSSYESIKDIPKSYLEAQTALDYRIIMGNGIMIDYLQVEDSPNEDKDLREEITQRLLLLLNKENFTKNDVDSIRRDVNKTSISIVSLRFIFLFVRDSIFERRKDDLPTIELQGFPDIFDIMRIQTFYELFDLIEIMGKALSETRKEPVMSTLTQQTIAILERISFDPNFSITALSDSLHVSRVHLNNSFKKDTGITVYEYVNKKRLKRIKSELEETEIPRSNNLIC